MTLVTPNRRLAVFHKREFDLAQQLAGRSAWPTPDILPYPAFVERTWRVMSHARSGGPPPQLIAGVQCHLLWEQVIRKSDAAQANELMNIAQAARQAASAWSLAHGWQLLPALQKFTLPQDAAMFLDWTRRYRDICREKGLIDAASLPDALAELLRGNPDAARLLPGRILQAGFDIVTPQQHHLWRVLREAGAGVEDFEANAAKEIAGEEGPSPVRVEFSDQAEELRACAWWARQQLQEGRRRIAIVVPDLQSARNRVARQLTDALMPGLRAQGAADHAANHAGISSLYNISLGQPLGDYGLVRDATALLEFAQMRPMPFLAASALLRSPYIAGAEKEMGARATLDAVWRERATAEITLTALHQRLAGNHGTPPPMAACPALIATVARVIAAVAGAGGAAATSARVTPATGPATPHDWSLHFGRILAAWGFPGERTLDSIDYQVLAKFRDALATLGTLGAVQPRMRAADALLQLRRIVADTMFQPESDSKGEAPIQVLGILESAGQTFDALWVTGLSDEAWPLAARPNPFIPAALQRAAGVPEGSAVASLALDTRITQGWIGCAPRVVLSHARTEGAGGDAQERAASALIRHLAPVSATTLPARPHPDYAVQLQAIGRRERIAEAGLPALPAPTRIRGGAGVMRDQAACPFRAFARHRLAAKTLAVPQAGPDARARGNLLHRVLYLVWGRIEDHTGLANLDAAAAARVVDAAASQAIAEARAGGAESLAGRFAEIEHARLCGIVGAWLEYERERAPFAVVGREAARTVTLAGLTMDLRIDRMDRLGDGALALIDYKSGVAKLASWLGARPDEPQLPLYLHTSEEAVSALAFARVKRGERRKVFGFEGVSAVEGLLPDVSPIEQRAQLQKQGYASWDVLTAEWESALTALATDFSQGRAEVDPKFAGLTCGQCDLQGVCRIAELRVARNEYAAPENGGEGDPDDTSE